MNGFGSRRRISVYDGPLIQDTYSNAEDYLASVERLLKNLHAHPHGGHSPGLTGARYRQVITDRLTEKQKTI